MFTTFKTHHAAIRNDEDDVLALAVEDDGDVTMRANPAGRTGGEIEAVFTHTDMEALCRWYLGLGQFVGDERRTPAMSTPPNSCPGIMKYTVSTIAGPHTLLFLDGVDLVDALRRALADNRADYQTRHPLAKLGVVDISHRPNDRPDPTPVWADGPDCAWVAGALGQCLVEPQAVQDVDLALLAALRRVVPGMALGEA